MLQDGVLDNHQQGLARFARHPFNWQLRQAALGAMAELKRPTNEILQIEVRIVAYDDRDLEGRILAGNVVKMAGVKCIQQLKRPQPHNKGVKIMQATASISRDDGRRVSSARATRFGVRLLNKYGLVLYCETCKATWFPRPAGDGSLPRGFWRCPNKCNW